MPRIILAGLITGAIALAGLVGCSSPVGGVLTATTTPVVQAAQQKEITAIVQDVQQYSANDGQPWPANGFPDGSNSFIDAATGKQLQVNGETNFGGYPAILGALMGKPIVVDNSGDAVFVFAYKVNEGGKQETKVVITEGPLDTMFIMDVEQQEHPNEAPIVTLDGDSPVYLWQEMYGGLSNNDWGQKQWGAETLEYFDGAVNLSGSTPLKINQDGTASNTTINRDGQVMAFTIDPKSTKNPNDSQDFQNTFAYIQNGSQDARGLDGVGSAKDIVSLLKGAISQASQKSNNLLQLHNVFVSGSIQ